MLRGGDLLKKEAPLTVTLIPEGRPRAQFLGLVAHPVRPLSKGGPVSSHHPSLDRARGKAREAIIIAVNGSVPHAGTPWQLREGPMQTQPVSGRGSERRGTCLEPHKE